MDSLIFFPVPAEKDALLAWQGIPVAAPRFPLDGRTFGADLVPAGDPVSRPLTHGGSETVRAYTQADFPGLVLELVLRTFPGSGILRFRYVFRDAEGRYAFTRGEPARYMAADIASAQLTEIQLAQFDAMVHSYTPNLRPVPALEREAGARFIGPITLAESADHAFLMAYEHGADAPDRYLEFAADESALTVCAVKGNTFPGQAADGWTSCWFQLGCAADRDALLRAYRKFLLEEISENTESRKPYLFYNTWNYQERINNYGGLPYLAGMTEERVMQEVDVAHRLGIDVFVIDTGWFGKTGDWQASPERFPRGFAPIREKLESYGMKMGLWFNPTVAARSSTVYREHPEWAMSRDGETHFGPIWETEESCGMCLASDYAAYHIEQMVKICTEWGVSYVKWDGIGQYGCNSPHHNHGTEANTPEERAEAYSYQMGLSMIHIVEEVTRRCPGVIFDFDVTEGGRFVGLGFLSAGKYFLVNNGPYAMDFDFPEDATAKSNKLAVGLWGWSNLFFFPGAARPRFCRSGALYDEIVPSILFLTHYLPDGPDVNQDNSLASLVLGGNGIWGDLAHMTEEEVEHLAEGLARYKKLAPAVTRAYPRVVGRRGISPEIHEKLDETGVGVVAFFAAKAGSYRHITCALPAGEYTVTGADSWRVLPSGALDITVDLPKDGARVVFVER